jgi:methylated-DNA-[protein]-cysteine S-methyltransferase
MLRFFVCTFLGMKSTLVFMKSFYEKVIEIVGSIPEGNVLTYGEVAKRAGSKGASRAVGSILAKNQDKTVPCHRVVRSDGSIGMYNGLGGDSKEGGSAMY